MNPLQTNALRHDAGTQSSRSTSRLAIALAVCALAACDQAGERPAVDAARSFLPAYAAPVTNTPPAYPDPAADAVQYSTENPQPPTF